MIRDQFKARATHFDQEQDMFLVSLCEGQATNIMTYDDITKVLDMQIQREYELEDKGEFFSLWYIIDHCIIKESNSGYEVQVNS